MMWLASSGGDRLLVVGAVVTAVSVLVYRSLANSTARRNLEAVAVRFHGTFVPGTWGYDRVEFALQGARAMLTYHPGSRSKSPFTQLRVDRVPSGYLRVFPEGFFASIRKMFGAQDIEIGDAAFDGRFVIQGSPEPWVREVLGPEARRRIQALDSLGDALFGGGSVAVHAGPAGVVILCERNLVENRARLDGFLDHAIALFDRIARSPQEGVRVLSAETHASRGDCPVCACPLGGDARRCPACATPHHADCWDYFGGCAIYGCRSRGGRRT